MFACFIVSVPIVRLVLVIHSSGEDEKTEKKEEEEEETQMKQIDRKKKTNGVICAKNHCIGE